MAVKYSIEYIKVFPTMEESKKIWVANLIVWMKNPQAPEEDAIETNRWWSSSAFETKQAAANALHERIKKIDKDNNFVFVDKHENEAS